MNGQVNILIVEDEGIVAMGLEEFLESENYCVVGIVDNGIDALEIIKTKPVDLVLLDIEIKGEWDGIETAKQIAAQADIPFIYLTAYSDKKTIDRAKETFPAAYLTKPYSPANIRIAIEMALHQFSVRKGPVAKTPITEVTGKPGTDSILYFNGAIFIKQNYRFVKINLSEILYLQAENNYTNLVTSEKKFLFRTTLQLILRRLNDDRFMRVHRSYAVNMEYVTGFAEDSVSLGEEVIPISPKYREEFLGRFDAL
jgi:DNA-binding LytR/AlgR family response regulator